MKYEPVAPVPTPPAPGNQPQSGVVIAGTRTWPRPLHLPRPFPAPSPPPSPPRACALPQGSRRCSGLPLLLEPGRNQGSGASPEPGVGLTRHALGAAPSRAGGSGPGRGPEFVGAALPSSSAWLARGDEEAFGAVSHRGQ